jgi:hypothetical protein
VQVDLDPNCEEAGFVGPRLECPQLSRLSASPVPAENPMVKRPRIALRAQDTTDFHEDVAAAEPRKVVMSSVARRQ